MTILSAPAMASIMTWASDTREVTAVVEGEVVRFTVTQQYTLRPTGHVFEGSRRMAADGAWQTDPKGEPMPGPLYQVDSSTVTASGTFKSRTTGENHVVEFRVEGALCLLP